MQKLLWQLKSQDPPEAFAMSLKADSQKAG